MADWITKEAYSSTELRSRLDLLFSVAPRSRRDLETAFLGDLAIEGSLPELPEPLADCLDLVVFQCPAGGAIWNRPVIAAALEEFGKTVDGRGHLTFRLELPGKGDRFEEIWAGALPGWTVGWEARTPSTEDGWTELERAIGECGLPIASKGRPPTLKAKRGITHLEAAGLESRMPSFDCEVAPKLAHRFIDYMIQRSEAGSGRRDFTIGSKIPSRGRDVVRPVWAALRALGWDVTGGDQHLTLTLQSLDDFEILRTLEMPLVTHPKVGSIAPQSGRWTEVAVAIVSGAPGYRLLFHAPTKREENYLRELLPDLELEPYAG